MSSCEEARFAIGSTGGARSRWHAVDLAVLGRGLGGGPSADDGGRGEVYSVCGQRCGLARNQEPFTDGRSWPRSRRCERCGWIVALSRGTVDCEIDEYALDAADRGVLLAAGVDPDLLRHIFIAILADAPPGRAGGPSYRSELLAHAARHRFSVTVCGRCASSQDSAAMHGEAVCPHAAVVCQACTFTAGPWAGESESTATGECVVSAPCSVLSALARHYGIAVTRGGCLPGALPPDKGRAR